MQTELLRNCTIRMRIYEEDDNGASTVRSITTYTLFNIDYVVVEMYTFNVCL